MSGMEILAGDGVAVRPVRLPPVSNPAAVTTATRSRARRRALAAVAAVIGIVLLVAMAVALTNFLRSPVEMAPGSGAAASPALSIRTTA